MRIESLPELHDRHEALIAEMEAAGENTQFKASAYTLTSIDPGVVATGACDVGVLVALLAPPSWW